MTKTQAQRRRHEITNEIAGLGFCLPGSFIERFKECSSAGCHCHADPANHHGPYRVWTRKVDGKTVSQTLNADQLERYGSWIGNAKRLQELIAELEQLSITVMAEQEAWPEPPVPPPDRRRDRSLR